MTENTDKAPQKPAKTAPGKGAGTSRSPKGKRAKAPGEKSAVASETAAAPAVEVPAGKTPPASGTKFQAPDPATISFGSNRPFVAPPPKLPESSGLRFSGSSAGELKASGPQPTSPKASGLTFSSAKAMSPTAKPTAGATKPIPAQPVAAQPATNGSGANGKDAAKKPGAGAETAKPAEAKSLDAKKPDAKAAEDAKSDAKKSTLTKPAIAPQASGRHFDKQQHTTSGFVLTMLALGVVGGGLALWMTLGNEAAAPQPAPASPVAEATLPAEPVRETEAVVALDPALRVAERPGLPMAEPAAEAALGAEELNEIQLLLIRLDFDPGSQAGVLTAQTRAAIRSYQEMAGLTADGEADQALLEELRSVVELYGN
jgi:hypothetical protein